MSLRHRYPETLRTPTIIRKQRCNDAACWFNNKYNNNNNNNNNRSRNNSLNSSNTSNMDNNNNNNNNNNNRSDSSDNNNYNSIKKTINDSYNLKINKDENMNRAQSAPYLSSSTQSRKFDSFNNLENNNNPLEIQLRDLERPSTGKLVRQCVKCKVLYATSHYCTLQSSASSPSLLQPLPVLEHTGRRRVNTTDCVELNSINKIGTGGIGGLKGSFIRNNRNSQLESLTEKKT